MAGYEDLARRLETREVIILDGAVGTRLQAMGVAVDNRAWSAVALDGQPDLVRRMHEDYIRAGADIITTNTYAAARHNLAPLGLGERTGELNRRAVELAVEARDRVAGDRPVFIAGSVSNFGLVDEEEPGSVEIYSRNFGHKAPVSDAEAKANLREQAGLLAEAGVDFLIAEPTGTSEQRHWVVEACNTTGLPVWIGFKCHLLAGDEMPRVGYDTHEPLAQRFDEIIALGGAVVSLFHSSVAATRAALPVVQAHWSGPIAVYPEAERDDYILGERDDSQADRLTPAAFVSFAQDCVAHGVQVLGGCCGVELEHIRPLREALPARLPERA